MPAAPWCFAFISYLVLSASSGEYVQFTISNNPVYSGYPVTLTCSYYGPGYHLSQVEVDAFNGSLKTGYMSFDVDSAYLVTRGVLSGERFNGYPNIQAESRSIGLTLIVNPSLELNYQCRLHYFLDPYLPFWYMDYSSMERMVQSSTIISMQVRVLPLPPVFTSNPLIVTDDDDDAIECTSPFGRPAATIAITIRSTTGQLADATGIESASLVLPRPTTNWHVATVNCTVTNHYLANMTVSSTIFINHVRSIGVPKAVNTTESGAMLDCSIYIRSFPGVLYQWSVPPESCVSNRSLLSSARFSAQRGQTGIFNCTATNVITMKTASVIFNLSSLPLLLAHDISCCNSTYELCWITAAAACRIVIFAVVFSLLFKGICSRKRNSSQATGISDESGMSSGVRCDVTNESLECVDQQYETLRFQLNNEPTYEQLFKAQTFNGVVEYANIGHLH